MDTDLPCLCFYVEFVIPLVFRVPTGSDTDIHPDIFLSHGQWEISLFASLGISLTDRDMFHSQGHISLRTVETPAKSFRPAETKLVDLFPFVLQEGTQRTMQRRCERFDVVFVVPFLLNSPRKLLQIPNERYRDNGTSTYIYWIQGYNTTTILTAADWCDTSQSSHSSWFSRSNRY